MLVGELPEEGSREHRELILNVAGVLNRFFGEREGFDDQAEAHRLYAVYASIILNAWDQRKAQEQLACLEEAIDGLQEAFRALPKLLQMELGAYARGIDEQKREDFLNCAPDIIAKSELPKSRGETAIVALENICEDPAELKAAIRLLNDALPAGVATRNRPMNDWAVIEAAAELCRARKLMNVPNSLGTESPFHRLLEALFRVFPTQTTPVASFKGWKKHVDTKRENLDLLDMY